ncbi:hypothetical protein AB1Y20_008085 [Prymnesium parvum]|uniref:Pirin n=1 Tax=Prymnesium parvum TaxID=97485 RepID=A0AB34IT78_PRYPA|mmetsp:Transcript_449/g.940  ORF Transcript_449/g.940 Transcript_449/m.940 type:complete len:394 (-) Transcript_449:471-1652(-)
MAGSPPERLSLPPLKPGEKVRQEGEREVHLVSSPLPSFGKGFNLFGAADIRGRGTDVEPSPHCDPFVLCSAAVLPPGVSPPFCAHPHCGASVVSILLQGGAMLPWDNVKGKEPTTLVPGGIYHVDSGAGCVHNERFEPISLRPRTEPGFGDEPDTVQVDNATPSIMMQLWWNAIDMNSPVGTPLRPVSTQVVQPSEVPRVVLEGGLKLRVLSGSYKGTADMLAPSSAHPTLLLHGRLDPNADGSLTELPADFNGFLWVVEGSLVAGNPSDKVEEVSAGERGLLHLPPGGSVLRLRNASSAKRATFVIGMGLPHRKPYYKYVGYGGGLIHRSLPEVEAAMSEYEADPKNFGRSAAGAKEGTIDTSEYVLLSGFQSDGGDMMERPKDVVARFAYA